MHHQPGFLVGESPGTFYQFNHLVGGCEVQSLGKGSLEVGLKELALPAMPVLERQIHAVGLVLRRHGWSIGEDEAKIFTGGVCRF